MRMSSSWVFHVRVESFFRKKFLQPYANARSVKLADYVKSVKLVRPMASPAWESQFNFRQVQDSCMHPSEDNLKKNRRDAH